MSEDFPPELESACKNFESSMISAEKSISPLLKSDRSELLRTASSLDAAKIDLVAVYALNSFYWAYLIMQGIDPKKHAIKTEIDRIRTYMSKVEEIKNRKNAPKLAKDAAKRFIRNAMFDTEEEKTKAQKQSLPAAKEIGSKRNSKSKNKKGGKQLKTH